MDPRPTGTAPSMRRLMLWLVAKLLLCADNLAEPMPIVRVDPFLASGHAFVARGQQLARVLFPGVERLLFFFMGKVFISNNVLWILEAGRGMFDLLMRDASA